MNGYHTPDGRLVYSLIYALETPPPSLRDLIVPLDENGDSTSPFIQACEPNKRVVTTKPGEYVLFKGNREKVLSVAPYRWAGMR